MVRETSAPVWVSSSAREGMSASPGWGPRSSLSGCRAQDAEEVAKLAEGLAAGAFDVAHGVDRSVEVVSSDGLGRAGLDGHHRDLVGHDVVELAGDAGSFVGDGLAGPSMLVGLQPFGAFLEKRQVVAAVADPAAHIPGQPTEDDGGGDVDALVDVDDGAEDATAITAATVARLWRWSVVYRPTA